MPMVKKEVVRINVNVNPEIKSRLDEYARENYMSQAAAVNLILKQFFDGQEALASMGNLTSLLQVISKQTGIDLGQMSERDGAKGDGAVAPLPERG